MNAVLSSNSPNQVPTNQHSFLLPVWLIFFCSSSSTISSSSSLQMTWEHSFPSSFIPYKCEHPFWIWCPDHFQLLAGWWKSFKNSWGKKNISTFFQEPSFFSRTFFFFIIPYLWLWWTLLFIISLFFFLIMVKHFCLSSSSLLHNGVQLSSSSSCSFVDMIKALLLHCHPFWTPSPHYHHLLSFFAWKWWTPKVGLFKLFLLICTWNSLEMHPLSIITFFKYSLTQNKGQKKNVMNKIKFYCYHEVVLSRYCCWEVDMEEWYSHCACKSIVIYDKHLKKKTYLLDSIIHII